MMNVHGQYVIYHPRDLTFLVLMAKRCLSNRRWWRRLEKTNAPSSITECAESAWRESWNAFQAAKKYAETVTVSKNAGSHHIVDARYSKPRVIREELLTKSFVTKYTDSPKNGSTVVDEVSIGYPVLHCDSEVLREYWLVRNAQARAEMMDPNSIWYVPGG